MSPYPVSSLMSSTGGERVALALDPVHPAGQAPASRPIHQVLPRMRYGRLPRVYRQRPLIGDD